MDTKFFDSSLFQMNSAQWWALAPYLWLCFGLFLATLFAAYRGSRVTGRMIAAIVFGGFSYFQATHLADAPQTLFSTGLEVDSVTRIIGAIVSFFALLTSSFSSCADKMEEHSEWLALLIISVLGISLLPGARDFVSFFVYLETFAISGYIMTSLDTGREKSLEAGLKYLLMGAFASALLLMGVALIYGISGSFDFEKISLAVKQMSATDRPFYIAGATLITCALLFKVAVVPFHMWSPDVYQAAPTGVAAFLASATKVSLFASTAVLLSVSSLGSLPAVKALIFSLACLTVIVGSLMAIAQTQVKRLLAYSGVVNAGYAAFALSAGAGATGSMITNLAIYGSTVIGLFALVENFVRHLGKEKHSDIDFRDLGIATQSTSPFIVALFSFGIFSLAGIPPLPGFFGKYLVLKDVWSANLHTGVYVMLVGALLGVAYYLRMFIPLYMTEHAANPVKERSSDFNSMTLVAIFAMLFTVMMFGGLNRFPAWIQIGEILIR